MDIWSILNIPPTKDIAKIKSAYAKQAKLYHPEEQPEEFKALQKAYKTALQSAKQKEKETSAAKSAQMDGQTEESSAKSAQASMQSEDVHAEVSEAGESMDASMQESGEEEQTYDFSDVDVYGYRERFFEQFFLFIKNPYLQNRVEAWDLFLNQKEYRQLFTIAKFRMNFVRTVCDESGWHRKTLLYFKRFLAQFHAADNMPPDGKRETAFFLFRFKQFPLPGSPLFLINRFWTKDGRQFQEHMLTKVQDLTGRSVDLSRKDDLDKYIRIYLNYGRTNEGRMKYLRDEQMQLRMMVTSFSIILLIYFGIMGAHAIEQRAETKRESGRMEYFMEEADDVATEQYDGLLL